MKKKINFFDRKYNITTSYQCDEHVTDARFGHETIKDVKTNKLLKQSKFVPIDRSNEMDKYKVSDFALENLLEVGATLKPCSLTSSQFVAIRSLEDKLSNIEFMSNNSTDN